MQKVISSITGGNFLTVCKRDNDNTGINYCLNKHLYRTAEFDSIDWKESVVLFGCSLVYGIGLEEKETISSQLEKIINRPVINMGVPGSSMMFSLYNSSILREQCPMPSAVVHLWTSATRYSKFTNNRIINYGAWNHNEPLMKEWADDTNVQAHALMTRQLAKQMWPSTVKYHDLTFFADTENFLGCDRLDGIDLSKDGSHPGKLSAQQTAKFIAEKLNHES